MKNTRFIIMGLSVLLGISILASCLLGYECYQIAQENMRITGQISVIQNLSEINANLYAVNHPIEKQFLIEGSDLAMNDGSTASQGIFYDKYRRIWKQEMDRYTALITEEISSEGTPDLELKFQEAQKEWEIYENKQRDFMCSYENSLHEGGTIIPIQCAINSMYLYKERTLNLMVFYYDHIMIGRGTHWNDEW